MKKRVAKLIDNIRIILSDFLASSLATWKFILIYTGMMLVWVILHNYGVLKIDSQDFIKYSLFLSWAAGIQASIVLMASNRQAEKDRKSILKGIDLDQKTLDLTAKQHQQAEQNIYKISNKINDLSSKLDKLEEIISLAEEEEDGIKNGK